MGIPFLLALSISSRRANSLLHFLKCVLSRPFLSVYSSYMFHDQFTFRKELHLVPSNSVRAGLVGVGVSSSSSFISTSSSNSSSKLEVENF
ncbi:hypothetical protein H5410_000085 [Solanum commersonii]|uniref:Uncharacterized protein n=1 Tax=Solanum commersonii TaxID=4109 RepID=A0A9J6AV29_SOLCO|nr:hypothetical protein H5410_000085 [Solanum commersonii]